MQAATGSGTGTRRTSVRAWVDTDGKLRNPGGAPATAHKGQCASETSVPLRDPSELTVTLYMPAAEQIISSCCGLTIGLATAAPNAKANHSSANLASQGVLRRVCRMDMGRDYGIACRDQKKLQ